MAERYDRILFAIAILLASGWAVGALTAVPMQTARIVGVLAATPFVYDALFRNPPVPTDPVPRAVAAIVWHVLLIWAVVSALA